MEGRAGGEAQGVADPKKGSPCWEANPGSFDFRGLATTAPQ
jgi:hypothetical protein